MSTQYIVEWITPDGDEQWTDEDHEGMPFQGITDARNYAEFLLDYNEATEVDVIRRVTTVVSEVVETILADRIAMDLAPTISDPMKNFIGFLTGK